MESNKEEAQKCIEIAERALLKENVIQASKFLNKSLKLYPSDKAKDLLEKILSESFRKNQATGNESTNAKDKSKSVPDLSELHGSSRSEKTFTPAQKELASKINKCKDYYAILGVEKNASDVEIKKAYRKMALQLHPDKNMAPGSTEAFKAVGKAFSVLSDLEKRRQYDLHGPDGVTTFSRRRRRNSDSNEDDLFDPQELFNMFFGGGYPSENVRVYRRGNTYVYNRAARRHHQEENQPWIVTCFRLLPLLVFLLASIGGSYFTSTPIYSLVRTNEYSHAKVTSNSEINYFVKPDFDEIYTKGSPALQELESDVETEHVNYLRSACYHERVEKETTRRKGIYFASKDLIKRAEEMTTSSCDELDKLFNRDS